MKPGDTIKINYENSGQHEVTVLRILEVVREYANGKIAGFVRVQFKTGQIKNVAVWG